MPESGAPYDRGWDHTKSRGSESTVRCNFCGAKVPRYKTIVRWAGLNINDPAIKQAMDDENRIHTAKQKQYICPSCARHRGMAEKKDRD